MTIIANLVNNAIKFTPEGGNITINFYEKDTNIELHIIDTGSIWESETPSVCNSYVFDWNVGCLCFHKFTFCNFFLFM